jgi:hypothetical protein
VTVPVPAVAPAVTVPVFVPRVTALAAPEALHEPPEVLSLKVTVVPAHSEITPCTGNGFAFTVTIVVEIHAPTE